MRGRATPRETATDCRIGHELGGGGGGGGRGCVHTSHVQGQTGPPCVTAVRAGEGRGGLHMETEGSPPPPPQGVL